MRRTTAIIAALALGACHLAAGLGDLELVDGEGGTSAQGGTSQGGSSTSTGGGGPCTPPDCNDDNDCTIDTCEIDGVCGYALAPAGSGCNVEGEAGACDSDGLCVPLHCSNLALDPGETDLDCGGTICPKCDNGLDCVADTDCKSNNCGIGDTCEPCEAGVHCATNTYCDTSLPSGDEICAAEKSQGDACADLVGECATGFCADGFCCDIQCVGTCQTCAQPGSEGACTSEPDGPSSDCGSEVCTNATLTTPTCTGGSCTSPTAPCPGGFVCDAAGTACRTVCSQPSDCQAGHFCNGAQQCVVTLAIGQPCTTNAQCSSGNCIDSFCCNTGCAGTCNACNVPNSVGICTDVDGLCTTANETCNDGACCTATGDTCSGPSANCCTGSCPGGGGVCP